MNLERIDKNMRAKLKRILEENSVRKNRISEHLREEPNSIERHIALLEYMRLQELYAEIAHSERRNWRQPAQYAVRWKKIMLNLKKMPIRGVFSHWCASKVYICCCIARSVNLMLYALLFVVKCPKRRIVYLNISMWLSRRFVSLQQILNFVFFRDNLRGALHIQETLQQLIATGNDLRAQQRTIS